jgi:hypothetical protein
LLNKLLIWAVLALTPFAGVRVICLDSPPAAAAPADGQVDGHSCREICARIKQAPSGSACALSATGESLLVIDGIAVMPPETRIAARRVTFRSESERREVYSSPAIARPGPPPKA